jgi:hypothetical protein
LAVSGFDTRKVGLVIPPNTKGWNMHEREAALDKWTAQLFDEYELYNIRGTLIGVTANYQVALEHALDMDELLRARYQTDF